MQNCDRYWKLGVDCPIHLSALDWLIGLSVWTIILGGWIWLLVCAARWKPKQESEYDNEFRRARLVVLKRDQYQCVVCHSSRRLNVHHRVPRSRGGSNNPSNLVTLCRYHHGIAHGQHWQ